MMSATRRRRDLAAGASPTDREDPRAMETLIGIALVVISVIEIVVITRVVSGGLSLPK